MIKAVLVMNTQGKPRLAKFYEFQPVEQQQEAIRNVFSVLCTRPEHVSNFVDAESFFGPMHTILDEIILGGQVLETSSTEVMRAIEEIARLDAASNAINLVPKSVSGWRSR
uniref:AP complex mu/sigma subunit domain-containing protein n=1 Tax=Phaseolus vulgaris TaxID=3885 RepID=V7C6W8_PHAVU|nr:hypothetical protein PHAVU_003G073000g [Phaseolus vulgaris]ESW25879.1 hypothetical protein PHAVU_003G073000g [Phaseolus vulgaris]